MLGLAICRTASITEICCTNMHNDTVSHSIPILRNGYMLKMHSIVIPLVTNCFLHYYMPRLVCPRSSFLASLPDRSSLLSSLLISIVHIFPRCHFFFFYGLFLLFLTQTSLLVSLQVSDRMVNYLV